MDKFLEIFTLVSGVLFLIFEIRQKNIMWVLQVLTAVTSVIIFAREGLYASMGLNVYYVFVAVWGFISWRRDALTLRSASARGGDVAGRMDGDVSAAGPGASSTDTIHLRTLTLNTIIWSVAFQIVGTAAFIWILRKIGDPMSGLDAGVTILSVIATWWLSRSIKEQWLLWILADILYTVLCLSQGLWWMGAMYACYTLAALYGYLHWKRNGQVVA